MGLLAREWYQCEDVSQLQSCGGPPAPAGLEAPEIEPNPEGDGQSDSLAFLFDDDMPGHYMDSLVKDWLAESGYDMFNANDE